VLIGLSACGLGIALGGARWAPFVVMLTCGLAVRAALALPVEHRANWIFRMTEDEATRLEQLRAVDHVATAWVVGLPTVVALAVFWPLYGSRALVGMLVVAVVGLLFVQVVLLDWRRVPFTCSYMPGKRFVAQSLSFAVAGLVAILLTGLGLLRAAIAGRSSALVVAAIGLAIAGVLRHRRHGTWRRAPLMFEDELPDRPMQLRLWQ
jgi:hypothetical protein